MDTVNLPSESVLGSSLPRRRVGAKPKAKTQAMRRRAQAQNVSHTWVLLYGLLARYVRSTFRHTIGGYNEKSTTNYSH